MDSLSPYDHVSPIGTDYPAGTYRVVGTDEGGFTVLRVGDADGRRVNTGEIVTISDDDLNGFETDENPDGNRPLGRTATSMLETIYWSARIFARQLATHPVVSGFAVALVFAGYFGEGVILFPEVDLDLAILLGSLGLAYIGGGRL